MVAASASAAFADPTRRATRARLASQFSIGVDADLHLKNEAAISNRAEWRNKSMRHQWYQRNEIAEPRPFSAMFAHAAMLRFQQE